MTAIAITIIALLILLNGIFVAAEFAIIAAPRTTLQRLAAGGSPFAVRLLRIAEDPRRQDQWVATAQLGITLASLGLGMYGEHLLAAWLFQQLAGGGWPAWLASHAFASVLSVTILTYFHIVVGEMVPKAIALQDPRRTSFALLVPMEVVRLLLFPLVAALNGVGNGILRMFRLDVSKGAAPHSIQELRYVIAESRREGALDEHESEVLRELIEFGDRAAAEILVPRVHIVAIPVRATREDIQALSAKPRHTYYPVFDETLDEIIGIVHIRDLATALRRQGRFRLPVRRVPFVPHSASLQRVLEQMSSSQEQIVVVMDEHGGTAGIVTIEDLFELVLGDLDEENRTPPIMKRQDGSLLVRGTVRLDEIGERLGIRLEDARVDTLSGLVLAELGRPAKEGDSLRYRDLRIEVAETIGRGVLSAVISRVAEGT
ncbi:MAG TPA: hemolysin family protein [Thermoanaerobaculia bacterium]|nr:hemolysin family protein [Thermoanaerobaculia bacterium]